MQEFFNFFQNIFTINNNTPIGLCAFNKMPTVKNAAIKKHKNSDIRLADLMRKNNY